MPEVQRVKLSDLRIEGENFCEARYGPKILDLFIILIVEDYVVAEVFNVIVCEAMFSVSPRRQLVYHAFFGQQECSFTHLIGFMQQL